LLFVHKFFHHQNRFPDVFDDYFILNRTVHSHITGDKYDSHVTIVNKIYGKKC